MLTSMHLISHKCPITRILMQICYYSIHINYSDGARSDKSGGHNLPSMIGLTDLPKSGLIYFDDKSKVT